ncbi:hypothetical protein INT47_006794 [Mucor saturninus]|uniref:Uncharacterized protein n=1 Tax=Mucor saturninus TaxID=64648 RepID=A0A8H7UWJ5_9FUNG|nr:hypothetical protein INT47_006794 [Mucor saturninus]
MDIVVRTIIGFDTKHCYYLDQMSEENMFQTLYLSENDSLPPIMIVVQHTVDNDFYLNVVSEAVAVAQKHRRPPIIIVFATSHIHHEVSKYVTEQTIMPFMWKILHCQPWADACYFVTAESIHSNLAESPLNPFVALSVIVFNVSSPPFHLDPTVKQLSTLMKQTFQDQATQRQAEDIMLDCKRTTQNLKMVIALLNRNELDIITKNIVQRQIKEAISIMDVCQNKYKTPGSASSAAEGDVLNNNLTTSIDSSLIKNVSAPLVIHPIKETAAPPANKPIEEASVSKPAPVAVVHTREESWNFVRAFKAKFGNPDKNKWENLYKIGKRKGYFSVYKNSSSMRSAYSRTERYKKMRIQ